MIIYDPPSGWMYGFPKAYRPLEGETIEQTLIRDGYPEKAIAKIKGPDGRLLGIRFLGSEEELDGLPPHGIQKPQGPPNTSGEA